MPATNSSKLVQPNVECDQGFSFLSLLVERFLITKATAPDPHLQIVGFVVELEWCNHMSQQKLAEQLCRTKWGLQAGS